MLQFDDKYKILNDGTEIAEGQIEGINFLLSHSGCILAMGTGYGKTLTVLTALKIIMDSFDNAKGVITIPVKNKKEFKKELFKRLGYKQEEIGIVSTDEFDYNVDRNKIFIFTDTNIEKYKDLTAEIASRGYNIVLIIDEAHKLQEKDSKFYNTMKEVKSISKIVWLVTATPLLNDLDSLYNIVDFACPGFLGKKYNFDNRYTVWHLKDQYVKGGGKRKIKVIDGYQNLEELNLKLQQVMFVRQKQYNLKFGSFSRDLTDKEYKIYEKVSSGILSNDVSEERNFSRRLHDLQRFLDRAYQGDELLKELVKEYNSTEYSTKEEMLLETLKMTLSKGYSTIIYADYKDTIERLHKVLTAKRVDLGVGRIFEITGSVDMKTREKVEDKIQASDVVLITSAGSESINLQRCNCIIFYDIPFSTKTVIQAVGRVCRRDTTHDTQYAITLYTKGTVDEYKYQLYNMNLDMVQRAVGAGKDIPLDTIGIDRKNIQKLKDSMLWAYKGGPQKERRRLKKKVKDAISISKTSEIDEHIARNMFLVEPIDFVHDGLQRVEALMPDKEVYDRYVRKEVPISILRSKYTEYLRSDTGKKYIKALYTGALKYEGGLLLVGDTSIPKILLDEILSTFDNL